MKRYLWVLALALVASSFSAVSLAADVPRAQQDDAFLKSLAQQAQEPILPALVGAPPPALPAGSCINLHCGKDSDCWPHCGGEYASYCSVNKRCIPY